MRHDVELTVSSLLSIVLLTIHLTQDIQAGYAPRGVSNMLGVLILVVWLYGVLELAGRRSGLVIVLLGSLLGAGVPVTHMMGAGIPRSQDAFFVWTLLALGVTASFSVVVATRALWNSHKARENKTSQPPLRGWLASRR